MEAVASKVRPTHPLIPGPQSNGDHQEADKKSRLVGGYLLSGLVGYSFSSAFSSHKDLRVALALLSLPPTAFASLIKASTFSLS
jgi:hypothetical protein